MLEKALSKLEVANLLLDKLVIVEPDRWSGIVTQVVNDEEFIVTMGKESRKVSIFDIRYPN